MNEPKYMAVYRLTTEAYQSKYGFSFTKKLNKQKRLSTGFDPLEEEHQAIGIGDTEIVGLDSLPDGLYSVRIVNVSTDYETGHVDDYDIQLFPYEMQGID